jgi:hypothetical protein
MDSPAAALAAFGAMSSSGGFARLLWLLKLGAPINLYFLASTFAPSPARDAHILIPARIFFAVSAYRCLFPVRYEHNVVFHDTPFSSIFVTRLTWMIGYWATLIPLWVNTIVGVSRAG